MTITKKSVLPPQDAMHQQVAKTATAMVEHLADTFGLRPFSCAEAREEISASSISHHTAAKFGFLWSELKARFILVEKGCPTGKSRFDATAYEARYHRTFPVPQAEPESVALPVDVTETWLRQLRTELNALPPELVQTALCCLGNPEYEQQVSRVLRLLKYRLDGFSPEQVAEFQRTLLEQTRQRFIPPSPQPLRSPRSPRSR